MAAGDGGTFRDWKALSFQDAAAQVGQGRTWLHAGGRVAVSYDPGRSGRLDEHGDVVDQPIGDWFQAEAYDAAGRVLGVGVHETDPAAALADLRGPGNPATAPPGSYSDEPLLETARTRANRCDCRATCVVVRSGR